MNEIYVDIITILNGTTGFVESVICLYFAEPEPYRPSFKNYLAKISFILPVPEIHNILPIKELIDSELNKDIISLYKDCINDADDISSIGVFYRKEYLSQNIKMPVNLYKYIMKLCKKSTY